MRLEMFVGLDDGGRRWYTVYVTVPDDTAAPDTERAGRELLARELEAAGVRHVAFTGLYAVYHDPPEAGR